MKQHNGIPLILLFTFLFTCHDLTAAEESSKNEHALAEKDQSTAVRTNRDFPRTAKAGQQGVKASLEGRKTHFNSSALTPSLNHRGERSQKPAGSLDRQPARQNQINQYVQQLRQRQVIQQNRNPQQQRNLQAMMATRNQRSRQASHQLKNQVKANHNDYGNWFNQRFFENHRYNPAYDYSGANGWRTTNWIEVNNWVGGGWNYPIYYDDQGSGAYLPATVNSLSEAEPEAYYGNNTQILQGQATGGINQGAWIPLGVFAVGKDVTQASYSNIFIQLAVNNQGYVAGTYYNAATDQAYPLQGVINRDTQQIVWQLINASNSVLMWTGLYNLTQGLTAVQMRFSNGVEQTWVLVA